MIERENHIKEINRLLQNHQENLLADAGIGLFDGHKHAEYFFKQLLNMVYPTWKLKHTDEKYGKNTPDIDLFSNESGVAVQITGQRYNFKQKITGTISGHRERWRGEYPKLKILFFLAAVDGEEKRKFAQLKEQYEPEGVTIFTLNEVITEVESNLLSEQVSKIESFLKEELLQQYPYKYVKPFETTKTGRENDFFSNTLQFQNDILFYSPRDVERIKNLESALTEGQQAAVLLEGPPCSGKTTLTFDLVYRINRHLKKSFYVDLRYAGDIPGIENDLSHLAPHEAILIVDNTQENYQLSNAIYNKNATEGRTIPTLFISRYSSSTAFTDKFFENEFTYKVNLNEDFADDSVLKGKIAGIVEKRIAYLRKSHPSQGKWTLNDMDNVFKHCELNFLKLSLILHYWEKEHSTLSLDDIDDEKLYESFYAAHKVSKISNDTSCDETLFAYAVLYKHDYPFLLANIQSPTKELIAKGIVLKRKLHEYYFFPHVEYANLLAKAISYSCEYSLDKEPAAIVHYVGQRKPPNVHVLVGNLTKQGEWRTLNQIICNDVCRGFLAQHYQRKEIQPYELNLFSYCLYAFRNELDLEPLSDLLRQFLLSTTQIRLNLFERDGFETYKNMKAVLVFCGIDLHELEKLVSVPREDLKKRFCDKSLFELSELVTKKSYKPRYLSELLNSFTFEEWMEKFHEQSTGGFNLVAESLNNLRTNLQSKQLAVDLYRYVDINFVVSRLKNASIDVIGKSLSELSGFGAVDSKTKPRRIFKSLLDIGALTSTFKQGRSKFSIGVSHLSKVDAELVQALFPTVTQLHEMFSDATAAEFAHRIPELIKCFPTKKEVLIVTMRELIAAESFRQNPNNDLIGLAKLLEILNTPVYGVPKSESETIKKMTLAKISKDENIIHLSEAVKVLKDILTIQELRALVNAENIARDLESGGLTMTHLEKIFYENLKHANHQFCFETYRAIPISVLVKASSRAGISFGQLTDIWHKMQTVEAVYIGGSATEHTHTWQVYATLLQMNKDALMFLARQSSVQEMVKGYINLFDLDSYMTEEHFYDLLNAKGQRAYGDVSISGFPQVIRKLTTLGSKRIDYKDLTFKILSHVRTDLIRNVRNPSTDIGQISTGLKELTILKEFSIEFSDFEQELFFELRFDIFEKAMQGKSRPDFETRIIPELKAAAGRHQEVIEEIIKARRQSQVREELQ
jgi:hypothetical protein